MPPIRCLDCHFIVEVSGKYFCSMPDFEGDHLELAMYEVALQRPDICPWQKKVEEYLNEPFEVTCLGDKDRRFMTRAGREYTVPRNELRDLISSRKEG